VKRLSVAKLEDEIFAVEERGPRPGPSTGALMDTRNQICSGAMTPGEAQKGIRTDWRQFLPQVNGVATKKKEIQ
jgi:hypothetical protein